MCREPETLNHFIRLEEEDVEGMILFSLTFNLYFPLIIIILLLRETIKIAKISLLGSRFVYMLNRMMQVNKIHRPLKCNGCFFTQLK